MIPILKNTVKTFFTQSMALLLMGLFVLGLGGYFWVLPGDQNLFDAGFGDLTQLFRVLPWGAMLLVSLLSMRLLSVPRENETLDLLLTRPLSLRAITGGYFLGAYTVFLVVILSTLSYPFTLEGLISGPHHFDWGVYLSGLLGLMLLGALWMAMGLLSSSLTKNPMVALVLSLMMSLGTYIIPGGFGPQAIYLEFVAGLLPVGGSLYLISWTLVLLYVTHGILAKSTGGNDQNNSLLWTTVFKRLKTPAVYLMIGLLAFNFGPKWDLTADKRFTLSETTQQVLLGLNQPVFIDVLLDGDLPLSFERLAQETQSILGRYGDQTNLMISRFDPAETAQSEPGILQELADFGIQPTQVTLQRNARQESVLVYPYAMVTYQGKTASVPLLKTVLGADIEERVTASIRHLEYAFTDALIQLSRPKLKKVAIMRGHEQASDLALTGFIQAIKPYYYVGPFTLDSVAVNPKATLEALKGYDLMVMADPKRPFNEAEKLVLDQFVMSGGSSLWLVDGAQVPDLDQNGQTMAMGQSLNLTDLLFAYGLRINKNLVLDVFSAPITLAAGETAGDYSQFPWWFSPLIQDAGTHPITAHVDGIKLDYVSSIDTLAYGPKKTVLLQSSPRSKTIGLPYLIDLNQEIDTQIQLIQGDQGSRSAGLANFDQAAIPMGVLLEGVFRSAFKNRVLPFKLDSPLEESPKNKMVVIADGSMIQNQVQNGQPLLLGFDSWTKVQFGNEEFLLNTVNYLLGDQGLINIRNKEINLPFLNPERIIKWRSSFLVLNLLLPLALVGFLSALIQWRRKRRYAR